MAERMVAFLTPEPSRFVVPPGVKRIDVTVVGGFGGECKSKSVEVPEGLDLAVKAGDGGGWVLIEWEDGEA